MASGSTGGGGGGKGKSAVSAAKKRRLSEYKSASHINALKASVGF